MRNNAGNDRMSGFAGQDLSTSIRPASKASSGGRIASLDGLRAVSISLVFASHLYWSKTLPALDFLWRFQLGDLGVRVFFVISGFLITHLLLTEEQRHGRISLRDFYVRRMLRIFPAYYAFIAFVAAASALGFLQVRAFDVVTSALYVSNYVDRPAALAHTWSLSVEEQFYILWPGILVLLGVRKSIMLAAAFTLFSAGLRAAYSLPISSVTNIFWVRFETAGDAIAIGCLFAALRARMWNWEAYRWVCKPLGTLLAVAGIGFLATSHKWPWFWNALGISLMDLCIVIVLDGCMRAQGCWHFRLLNCVPVVWLGVLSYSLYLWQQLFLTGLWRIPFPLNLALTFVAAWLSFQFIESPVARWRQRRAQTAT